MGVIARIWDLESRDEKAKKPPMVKWMFPEKKLQKEQNVIQKITIQIKEQWKERIAIIG
jgi:hypothetical protein